MEAKQRPNPLQIALAALGVALAIAGAVRLGQGRPDRSAKATAETVAAAAAPAAPDTATITTATDMAAGDTPASKDVAVDIAGFAFAPDPLAVAVGTKVTWTNKDSFAHTATADDATVFDSGNLNKDKTFSYVFDKIGTYTYKCAIHNSMTGTITVA